MDGVGDWLTPVSELDTHNSITRHVTGQQRQSWRILHIERSSVCALGLTVVDCDMTCYTVVCGDVRESGALATKRAN